MLTTDGANFTDKVLGDLIDASISLFNETAPFTNHLSPDRSMIIHGALLLGIAATSLINQGKGEFTIENGKISFEIPTLSEVLNSVWASEIESHINQLKLLKESL